MSKDSSCGVKKVLHHGGQRFHPAEGETGARRQKLQCLLIGMRVGAAEAQNPASGPMSGSNACYRILDNDAVFRLVASAARRLDEYVRLGLWPQHMLETGD